MLLTIQLFVRWLCVKLFLFSIPFFLYVVRSLGVGVSVSYELCLLYIFIIAFGILFAVQVHTQTRTIQKKKCLCVFFLFHSILHKANVRVLEVTLADFIYIFFSDYISTNFICRNYTYYMEMTERKTDSRTEKCISNAGSQHTVNAVRYVRRHAIIKKIN